MVVGDDGGVDVVVVGADLSVADDGDAGAVVAVELQLMREIH